MALFYSQLKVYWFNTSRKHVNIPVYWVKPYKPVCMWYFQLYVYCIAADQIKSTAKFRLHLTIIATNNFATLCFEYESWVMFIVYTHIYSKNRNVSQYFSLNFIISNRAACHGLFCYRSLTYAIYVIILSSTNHLNNEKKEIECSNIQTNLQFMK